MARCGCASDQCGCTIVAGDGIEVSGTGSRSNPVVVTAVPTSSGGGGGGDGRFSGEIVAYGGGVAPAGWLLCQGQAVSRTAYAALFTVIGVAYGGGDGVNTFNIPDFRDRVIVGASSTKTRGSTGGTATTALTTANLPAHSHSIDHDHPSATTASGGTHDHETNHSATDGTSASTFREGATAGRVQDSSLVINDGAHTHTVDIPSLAGTSGSVGSGDPVNNLPPYGVANAIIKV